MGSLTHASLRRLGVIGHAADIEDDHGLIADDPGVVAWRQQRHVAGAELLFTAVVHADAEPARDVVLEVRGLATLGLGHGFERCGPLPARLKRAAAEGDTA